MMIVMRSPCKHACPTSEGYVVEHATNQEVRCVLCNEYQYNAPKSELGLPTTSKSTRPDIKPKKRARILARDVACVICHHDDVPLEVGHLISVQQGHALGLSDFELFDDDNLAAMCAECNAGLGSQSINLVLMAKLLRTRIKVRTEQP